MGTTRLHHPPKTPKKVAKPPKRTVKKKPPMSAKDKTFFESFEDMTKKLPKTAPTVACTVEMVAPRYGRLPLPTIHVTNASDADARAVPHELAAWLFRNGINKYGAVEVKSHTVIIEPVKDTDVSPAYHLLRKAVKAVTNADPTLPKLNRVPPGETPKPGHHIYVRGAMYLSHGVDDFNGGIATVKDVKSSMSAGKMEPFIEIVERPGHGYNWTMLKDEQERLEKEYGAQWSHPDPDTDPSANRWD